MDVKIPKKESAILKKNFNFYQPRQRGASPPLRPPFLRQGTLRCAYGGLTALQTSRPRKRSGSQA